MSLGNENREAKTLPLGDILTGLHLLAGARSGVREEPKDTPVTLIPGLGALPLSLLHPIWGLHHYHPHPPLQPPLTDAQLQGDMIGGLIGTRQEEDHVERLPTAENQLIVLELVRVVLSAVLV